MSGNLLDLANRLEKRLDDIEQDASKIAIKTALKIEQNLVLVTPVDTSAALSNWQVSLNTPISSDAEIEPHVPGILGYTGAASGRAAMEIARRVLANKKPGQSIFISNVIDYIVPLNEGSSRQAPAGFVERAVLLGRKSLETARLTND